MRRTLARTIIVSISLLNLLALNHVFAADQNADLLVSASTRAADPLLTQALQYEHGEGVPKDMSKAAELYCTLARQGNAEAAYKLGWMYANGRGDQRDDGYAVALLQQAAAQDHAYAQRTLQLVHSDNVRLPPCMTPPPPPAALDANSDKPLPVTWLTEEKRAKIVELARKLAPEFDIDPRLVLAVIAAESGFDTNALSAKNAQGLMQLIPETAERFNVKKVLDPAQNMRGGMAYLRWLLAYFQGDVPLVLAAYNAGEGAVERYKGVPPFSETRQYVDRIIKFYGKATHRYNEAITEPSPIFVARKSEPMVTLDKAMLVKASVTVHQ